MKWYSNHETEVWEPTGFFTAKVFFNIKIKINKNKHKDKDKYKNKNK